MLTLVLAGPTREEPPAAAPTVAGELLMISDLHFDPMADPRLVDRLIASEIEDWPAVLDSSGETSLGRYGADTNSRLLRSALGQMRETLPDATLLLLPGDFLAHDFRPRFDAAASEHSDAAYRGFVAKTMRFLAQQIRVTFPNSLILPALGNNDDECGDFLLQPDGPFLADMLPVFRALVGGNDNAGFDQDWTRYGNYRVAIRGLPGVRVVSVNSVFFSPRYRNACGPPGEADPGRATLAWLEAELAAAHQAQERVWLVYHVPPGVDGFATLVRGSCPSTIIPMWDAAYAERFYALLRRYEDTVVASFAGHTHMDDFRLIGDGGGYYAFALITPALSPIFGQNPAFRTVAYDSAGGALDQTTYDLANFSEATGGSGAPAVWQTEYTFSREWHQPRVDLASLERLYAMSEEVPEDRGLWHTLFAVSSPIYWSLASVSGARAAQAVRAFRCASGHVLLEEYRQCYCGGEK